MEYLDIVDEYGNKTGEILDRETAHDLNKLHWEVTVYVVNKNGQLLLEKIMKAGVRQLFRQKN